MADVLSRWAYPASEALRDISIHGNLEDHEEVMKFLEKEREEERECMLFLRDQPCPANLFVRGITSRSGKQVKPPKNSDYSGSSSGSESEEQGEERDAQLFPPVVEIPPVPKHVTFKGA